MKNITFYFILITIGLTACKKKDQDQQDSASSGVFELHLHTNIDTNEVDEYNIVYTTESGRKMSLSLAQMYISNIQLVKIDGTLVDFSGKKILKVLDIESYLIGNAPAGNYKAIRFRVGLDSMTNISDPENPNDSDVLNKKEMWFGSSAQPDGYVYMNVQGKIDTTADASGAESDMQPFSFKIGTMANYTQVIMPDKNFSIVPNQVEYGHITIDYSAIFEGLQLSAQSALSVESPAANSQEPALTIVKNIPGMFSYEE